MKHYQTDYPNQVHQLIISVSKHLWVSKDNRLLSQKKPFEIDLRTREKAKKEHLVHYLLSDHFSGVVYGETCTVSNMIHLGEFIHRAWSQKAEYIFCGIPEMVTVPQTVLDTFPQVVNLLSEMDIKIAKVTSGFQGGVRDVRTWEDRLCYESLEFSFHEGGEIEHRHLTFPEIQAKTLKISSRISGLMDNKSKIDKWKDNIKTAYIPPPLEEFLSYYKL